MVQPGKIALQGGRQLIFSAPNAPKWFRITNTGANVLGVTFTDNAGNSSLSAQIAPNTSKDFIASRIEIRDETGNGVAGMYEAIT